MKLGVWGEWRTVNTSKDSEWIPHFPKPKRHLLRLAGHDLKNYYRAQAAFCVISLALMLANNAFAIYTFSHKRYIYKVTVPLRVRITVYRVSEASRGSSLRYGNVYRCVHGSPNKFGQRVERERSQQGQGAQGLAFQ